MAKGSSRLFCALFASLAFTLFGAVAPRSAVAAPESRHVVPVLVPEVGNLQAMAFWAALGAGFFTREGLDVQVIAADSPALVQSGFKGGIAPVALLPGVDYERLISDRFPFLLVANLLQNDPIELIVRRELAERLHIQGKPVRQRLDGLRGVALGVAPRDRPRLYELFHSQGLDANLAQILLHKGDELPAAFTAGQIDAMYAASPYMEQALVGSDTVVLIDLAAGEVPAFGERMIQALAVTPAFQKEHPDQVEGLVRAIAHAEHLIRFEPKVATDALVHVIPKSDRKRTARAVAIYGRAVPATPHAEAELIRRDAHFYPVGGEPLHLEGVDLDSYVLPTSIGYEAGPAGPAGPGSGKPSSVSARTILALLGLLVLAIGLLVVIIDQREPAQDGTA